MGSQSRDDRRSTHTSPDDGVSNRLMSFRQVVFPDPLRPSSIRVSPRRIARSRFDSTTLSGATVYPTFLNSMAKSGSSFILFPWLWVGPVIAHQPIRTLTESGSPTIREAEARKKRRLQR